MIAEARGPLPHIPKAELHCHIEGALPPDLVRALAARNGIRLPESLFDIQGGFRWHDFKSFLDAYDLASSCLKRPEDYRDLARRYLLGLSGEGAVYAEFFASPDHAAAVGLSYGEMIAGLAEGIKEAEAKSGIVARIIVVCVRHLGPERAEAIANQMATAPHPLVAGFGMAGDETRYRCADFQRAYRIAAAAGLACTAHAGEAAGPESVWDAIEHLPVTRLGHGVRAVEDKALLFKLIERRIALEVCPGSNLALGFYPDAAAHPLGRLVAAGCRVTLNSDDPPFFHTSLGAEYARAQRDFGLDDAALRRITDTALDAAFVDPGTRQRLKRRAADFSLPV